MKSQTEINQAFKDLLVVDLAGNGVDTPWDIFMAEGGWRINMGANPNKPLYSPTKAVKEWMLGLPSILNMPFTYHEVGEWLQENTGFTGDCFDSDIQDKRYWEKAAMIFVKLYQPK